MPSLRYGLTWQTKIDKVQDVNGCMEESREYSLSFPTKILNYRPLASDLPEIQHTYSYITGEGTITKLAGKISRTKTDSLKGEDKQQAGEEDATIAVEQKVMEPPSPMKVDDDIATDKL
uniref:Uncharacterized protein n=1 Tax=Romanomermis culicivorax TaxID=13658 RepID=A0A915JDN8_ROMCU